MKRRYVHFGFLGITCASACFIALQAWHVRKAEQINAQVESISDTHLYDPLDESENARILLRSASAQSRAGEDSEAERLFGILSRDAVADEVRVIAQYNLGNHFLRKALSATVETNAIMPLVELAKQRYRDVLKQAPDHWHARYNLEQALRLAPEGGREGTTEEGEPIKRVDVVVPDFELGDLP